MGIAKYKKMQSCGLAKFSSLKCQKFVAKALHHRRPVRHDARNLAEDCTQKVVWILLVIVSTVNVGDFLEKENGDLH
jgi:hypothetical protein